jgi:hypothetical protein
MRVGGLIPSGCVLMTASWLHTAKYHLNESKIVFCRCKRESGVMSTVDLLMPLLEGRVPPFVRVLAAAYALMPCRAHYI